MNNRFWRNNVEEIILLLSRKLQIRKCQKQKKSCARDFFFESPPAPSPNQNISLTKLIRYATVLKKIHHKKGWVSRLKGFIWYDVVRTINIYLPIAIAADNMVFLTASFLSIRPSLTKKFVAFSISSGSSVKDPARFCKAKAKPCLGSQWSIESWTTLPRPSITGGVVSSLSSYKSEIIRLTLKTKQNDLKQERPY